MDEIKIIKFLSSSPELKLRQLRSYAMSIGGTAEKFETFAQLLESFDTSDPKIHTLCIIDSTCILSESEFEKLKQKNAEIFMILPYKSSSKTIEEESFFQLYQNSSGVAFVGEKLFFNSTVIRQSISLICNSTQHRDFKGLFHWGKVEIAAQIAKTSSHAFIEKMIKDFSLDVESIRSLQALEQTFSRNLDTEMFKIENLSFYHDGLLLGLVASFKAGKPLTQKMLAELLFGIQTDNHSSRVLRVKDNQTIEIGQFDIFDTHTQKFNTKAELVLIKDKNHALKKTRSK